MVASSASLAATPAKTKKRRKASTKRVDHERIDRLQKTEVAFIPNDSFSKLDAEVLRDESPLLRQVEEADSPIVPTASEGLPNHLGRMCATPLLSPSDETSLFRAMNYRKYRANALRTRLNRRPELAGEVEECLLMAERVRNYIVQANTRLVLSIARRFADARNSFDDLLSQGVVSLMHAVEKFDFDRGYRFSTYATCAVRRDLYRLVMGRKKDLQRFATGTAEHLDACPDEREPDAPNALAEWKALSGAVTGMLGQLDDRERFIVSKRYGLDGGRKKASYSVLGRELGISKERVRQLANRAMDKLRDTATELRLDALIS